MMGGGCEVTVTRDNGRGHARRVVRPQGQSPEAVSGVRDKIRWLPCVVYVPGAGFRIKPASIVDTCCSADRAVVSKCAR